MKKLLTLLLLLAPSVLAQNPVSGGPIPQSTYQTPSTIGGGGGGISYGLGSGTAQAQIIASPSPTIGALTNGVQVCWLPVAANTAAAPTLQVGTLAAKPITKYGTVALVANDITTAGIACAIYDGTEFQMQVPLAGGAFSGSLNIGSGASAAGATATGGFAAVEAASTGWTPTAGQDYCRADSTLHSFVCSENGVAEVLIGDVNKGQTNVYGAFLQDFAAATMKLPIAAGFTTTVNSTIGRDTTANTCKVWVNSADAICVAEAAAIVTNTVPKATDSTHGLIVASSMIDNGTSVTSTDTGGFIAPVFVSNGTTAGFVDYPQGSTSTAVAPCNTATSICEQAPAAVTSYLITKPGAAPTANNALRLTSSAGVETFNNTLPTSANPIGIYNFNQAAQSQVVVSATEYYITRSDLDMPAAYNTAIGAGTAMKWRVSLNKTAAGTGTFQVLLKKGTNGSTADTSIVTQTIGTQTAAADNMEMDVQLTWTSATASYWTIIPRQSAASGTGFGLVYPAVAAQFNGTISGQTTTTASDKYGLSVIFTTGTPTFLVTEVQAQAFGVN